MSGLAPPRVGYERLLRNGFKDTPELVDVFTWSAVLHRRPRITRCEMALLFKALDRADAEYFATTPNSRSNDRWDNRRA